MTRPQLERAQLAVPVVVIVLLVLVYAAAH